MDTNYPKAYKEVVEILKNVPEEDVNKIPKDLLNMFNNKMDNEYEFEIDTSKEFEDLEIMEETKAIFANIYRDYWATPEQKARILATQANEILKIEQIKKQKYNSDNLFEKEPNEEKNTDEQEKSLIIINDDNIKWYKKFIQYLKVFFSNNN